MERFYLLFESIWKYQQDVHKFIEDLDNGYYIQHSLESILDENEGKQLLAEALYLYGVMLLFMDEKLPGVMREKIVVSLYRYNGDGKLGNFEEISRLTRRTGYVPATSTSGGRKPKDHPSRLFKRFPPNEELVRQLLGKLTSDDIYLMSNSYPDPEQRSSRLATQGSMLYVILYFAPNCLKDQTTMMRGIVDKFFADNWMIPVYMGHVVDLTVEWAPYEAAKKALDTQLTPALVKELNAKNLAMIESCQKELKKLLSEGVFTDDYLADNIPTCLSFLRSANIALRWRVLHRHSSQQLFAEIINKSFTPAQVTSYLLNLSQFEYLLKEMLKKILDAKDHMWNEGRTHAANYLKELSEYFTGEKALTRVKRNDRLIQWFVNLSNHISNLNLETDHATATGRKIKEAVDVLKNVEMFEEIDSNLQVKSFLEETRELLRQMIRTVNIKSDVSAIVENITDFSYAWVVIKEYTPLFHEKIYRDPNSVILLRATFRKAASILDIPMTRIVIVQSPDEESVAEYYSSELVQFVRSILEIIPISVFQILNKIQVIQSQKMKPLDARMEAKDIKEFAQVELRLQLARLTQQVSIFTEGILLMQRTLLGVIEIDPRQVLEEGLRRELVRLVSMALHQTLSFKDMSVQEITLKYSQLAITLDGIKRSIEYLQDFIDMAGLKLYQEEMMRVINYNVEQEANKYLKRKIFDSNSRYQSKVIPLPRFQQSSAPVQSTGPKGTAIAASEPLYFDKDPSMAPINFMGRIMESLLFLTDSASTVYSPEYRTWYSYTPKKVDTNSPNLVISQNKAKMECKEICGLQVFGLMDRAFGTTGMQGLDRLLSFRIVHQLKSFEKFNISVINAQFQNLLDKVKVEFEPTSLEKPGALGNIPKLCAGTIKMIEGVLPVFLSTLLKLGQNQLLRSHITQSLQFNCHMDAHVLHLALNSLNTAVLNDMKRHYGDPDKFAYPEKTNPLLFEMTRLLESCGMDDSTQKIYITAQPLENLPLLVLLFLITYVPKVSHIF